MTRMIEEQRIKDQSVPVRAIVDDSPAWSPDGRLIAFHRRFPSSYGPAGLYIIPRHGGDPRFLLPGGFFFPTEVSFAPDGRRLVCNDGNQLAFVDLVTGAVSRPMFTDNAAAYPDWSPDGRSVVYARIFLRRFPPEPPDSAGLHVVDVLSGVDRPLRHSGAVLPSGPAQWIRNGKAVALIHADFENLFLSVADFGTNDFHPVTSVRIPTLLWNLQHLEPSRPRSGPLATESVVFLVFSNVIEKTLQVSFDPIVISERGPLGTLWDALSPTGLEVASIGADPTDSLGVLFVGKADAPLQAKKLQLTRYDPP